MRSGWRKWLLRAAGVFALGMVGLAMVLAYDAPCGSAPPLAAGPQMRAVVQRCYGPADVLQLETLPKPQPAEDEVLVRVHSASINPVDRHFMHGTPYVLRFSAGIGAPGSIRVGTDFAGIVEQVGARVTRFKPGDAVFGAADGAFGEYIVRREQGAIARVPAGLDLEQAAAMPVAAVTALQALRDKAAIRPGQKVLVNGASGGVGTFAVQIAKALGAEVTGVCSTRNLELVRSLGADHVIDYTQQDFTRAGLRYDAIIDMAGNHSVGELAGVLTPDGALVSVGATYYNPWLEPFASMLNGAIQSLLRSQRIEGILARITGPDLDILAGMAAAGQLKAVIERRYALAEVADAMRHLETGRARGKLLVSIAAAPAPGEAQDAGAQAQ